MATSRRVARVAELIRREVSQLLFSDIKDKRVGMGMVSVTDVDVAGDLQHAKIYVSVYGTDEARAEAMLGLKSATGFVRSELGQRLQLRRTPEITFLEDRSIERGTKVLSLINQLSQERKPMEEGESEALPSVNPSDRFRDAEDGLEDFEEDDWEDTLDADAPGPA